MTSIEPQRSTSPRPPAVGEESKMIHEASEIGPESGWSMDHQAKQTEQQVRSSNPSCYSATESADSRTVSSDTSSRSAYKWAQSLRCLLEDTQGVELFQNFLKQEGQDNRCLKFWFACKGVKRIPPSDRDGLVKLVNIIYDKQIKRISAISEDTREDIRQRLSMRDIDKTIFDAAEQEVENYVALTTYPNFLKSDLYIQYLDTCMSEPSAEKENPVSVGVSHVLPTVHEDSELRITKPVPLTKNNLLQRHIVPCSSKLKLEGPAGYLKNPYNSYSSYHAKYGSYLPASAQDSELQSLSSDALSEDTMSLSNLTMSLDDLTIDKAPIRARNMQRKHHKFSKRESTPFQNDNMIIHKDDGFANLMPRMTNLLTKSAPPQSVKEFHRILTKKLNKVVEGEKMMEKLSVLESAEKGETTAKSKPNPAPLFNMKMLCDPPEENENDQWILDQHFSRVWSESGQHSPAMSSGCLSPPGAKAAAASGSCQRSSVSAFEKDQISVPNNLKPRKDQDTISTDSAMFDYASDDNMSTNYKSHSSGVSSDLIEYNKQVREHSKRYMSKKLSSLNNSSSSCVDSGISLACESEPAYSEVTCWLETRKLSEAERENVKRNSSHSSAIRSSRKGFIYKSQNACLEAGCSQWSAISTHVFQDNRLPCSDATTNFAEARRLEEEFKRIKLKNASGCRASHDMSRMKFPKGYDSFEENLCHKKMSRKSFPGTGYESASGGSSCNDVTVIGYSYGRHSVPYLSKLPGKNITLRQFKSLLSKKGNFRYFFKTASNDFGTGVVFEEVTDDYKVCPLWEGKVFCVIESMDDSPGM